jgi:diguanylate cyclase (GGDEF)-like protein
MKRIGILLNRYDTYNSEIYRGAKAAVNETNNELVIFYGGYFDSNHDLATGVSPINKTVAYKFVNYASLDLLIIPLTTITQKWIDFREEFIKSFKCPVVVLGETKLNVNSMRFKNNAVYDAVSYMIEHGNRNHIAIISGYKHSFSGNIRVDYYKKALVDHQLEVNDDLILYCKNYTENNYDCIQPFLAKHPEIDAVMCVTDDLASCVYKVLDEMNKTIGDDVLVCGFDDNPDASNMNPPLASCNADPSYLAYRAILAGLDYLDDHKIFHISLDSHFIIRKSLNNYKSDHDDLYIKEFLNDCLENGDSDDYIASGLTYILFLNKLTYDSNVKIIVHEFYRYLIHIIRERSYSSHELKQLKKIVYNLITFENCHYVAPNVFLGMITEVVNVSAIYYPDDIAVLKDYIYEIYNQIILSYNGIVSVKTDDYRYDINILNELSKSVMSVNHQHYTLEQLELTLKSIYARNSRLISYNTPIEYHDDYQFEVPENIKVTIEMNNNVIKKEKNYQIATTDILNNMNGNIKILTSIYFSNTHYGIIITDTSFYSINKLEIINTQIGTSYHIMEMMKELNHLAAIDQLTKVYNRRGLYNKLEEVYNSNNQDMYLLMADIDNLKYINDFYGHNSGDAAIVAVADILKTVFKDGYIGRMGGDEYIVLFDNRDKILNTVEDQIKNSIDCFNAHHDYPFNVSFSYGISTFDRSLGSDAFNQATLNADQLMYEAKNKHKALLNKNNEYINKDLL